MELPIGFGELTKEELENIRSGEITDEVLYAYLLKQDPDGKIYLTQQEQEAFEKEMGL